MVMAMKSFLAVVFMALMAASSAHAYDFHVGGKDGWVENPKEKFNHWAERMRFQVNDSLVFKYKKGEDSVLLVKKENYLACNTKNPIKKMEDGQSVFDFDRSGAFFFISGHAGSCWKGQKLVVVVMAVRDKSLSPISSPSPAPSPSKPSPSHSPSPSPSTSTKYSPSPSPSPSPSSKSSPSPSKSSPSPSPSSSKTSPSPSPSPSPSSKTSPSPSSASSKTSPAASPEQAPSPSFIEAPSPAPSTSSSSFISVNVVSLGLITLASLFVGNF